ncbi:HAD family hydrolase [Candidatus Neptunichlamydia sp. REUL1]|uniref:HAD family hydrolase n=1 Tax=Candidatus Neptunichlamydia sp. REUL1 TaxID=3064277 RepID=UPI00292F4264|nr:HAD family hydrolase [Candidatus Neptunochlamydia sp. REUL1]
MTGTIALDIDGTITDRDHLIPDEVAHYFETLHKEGWRFIFVTGRPLSFTMMTLPKLCFPYFLGVQNGSALFEMPEKKEVERYYLSLEMVHILDTLHKNVEGDFLVYSGYEKGDTCYFRPDHFSDEMRTYLKKVEKVSDAPWIPLKNFDIKEQHTFPLIKCLGPKEEMESFDQKLQKLEGIKTTLIKDPFSESLYLILITHSEADKGIAIQKIIKKFPLPAPLITGGNDNNDIPLLQYGDQRIAIKGAPEALIKLATVIAPPSEECGIIEGLKKAMENLS